MRKVLYYGGFAVNTPENLEVLLFTNTSKSEEYYATTFSILDEMNEITKNHNATLVLVLIPSKYHVNKELWQVFWQVYSMLRDVFQTTD